MSADRLPAGLEAAGLIRTAQAAGDFATILKRGDAERGVLLLFVTSRGRHVACLERTLGTGNAYCWNTVGPAESADGQEVATFFASRTRFDPDLWAIELDVAQPERFIAETTFAG